MASSDFPRLTLRDLFDADFYRTVNPDLAGLNDRQLFSQFENQGVYEGRRFSPFFNLDFYLSNNSDVNTTLGANRKVALDHFLNSGIFEGRRFSEIFDLDFYRRNNPDLAGLDNSELFNHFLKAGLNEGRIFTPLVDLNFYRAANSDLAGLDNAELFNHFITSGINEGRPSLPLFDLDFYKKANPDLSASALDFDNADFLNHFLTNGLAEGRRFTPFFDVNYYRLNNPDLLFSNLSNQQLLEHFQRFGLDEGRRFSQFFDMNYYLANSPDLRAAGLGPRQAFNHFVNLGIFEGRRPSLLFDPRYYLANNPDLFARGLSFEQAFEDFQISGFLQARSASIFFDPEAIAPLLAPRPEFEFAENEEQRPGDIPSWLLAADEWDDIPVGGTLTYSFVTTASAFLYEGQESGVRELPIEIKNQIRNIMRQYDDILPINLIEVADRPPNVGQIRFMFSNGPEEQGALAYAYLPSESPGIGLAGDVHLTPDRSLVDFAGEPGSFGYAVLLHEIGHALGLDHPFRDRPNPESVFEPVLPVGKDNDSNTVMSYSFLPVNYQGAYARTPMAYDIRALQYLYGASYLNNTDTTYRFEPTTFIVIKQTLWDSGGIDLLDFSNLPVNPPDLLPGVRPEPLKREGYYFDMNEGGYLTAQNALSRATYVLLPRPGSTEENPLEPISITNNIYGTTIAYGAEIENLIGSPGNDEILGNNLSNFIAGGAGDDQITGARGADIVTGGPGADIFVVGQGDGGPTPALADQILDFTKGQDRIGLALGLPFGALAITQGTGANANDTLIRIASTGEYLAVLTGVRATDINFFDSTPV